MDQVGQLISQWMAGQLTDVFGLSKLWVGRFAEVLQFLSGLVLAIELIGRERMEELAQRAIPALDPSRPLVIAKAIWLQSKKFAIAAFKFLSIKGGFGPMWRISKVGTVLFALLCTNVWLNSIAIASEPWNRNWHLVWKFPLLLLSQGTIHVSLLLCIGVLLLGIVAVVNFAVAALAYSTFSLARRLLSAQGMVRPIIAVSLALFVFAFLLKIVVS